PVEGGNAVQLTEQGGFTPFESPDGKYVYYCKSFSAPGLWRVPLEGGEEMAVFNLKAGMWGNWALVNDGIYFIDWVAKKDSLVPREFAIEFFSFATHQITQVAWLGKITICFGLAASPDHRWILYTQE